MTGVAPAGPGDTRAVGAGPRGDHDAGIGVAVATMLMPEPPSATVADRTAPAWLGVAAAGRLAMFNSKDQVALGPSLRCDLADCACLVSVVLVAHRVPSLQELIRRRQARGFVGRGEQLAQFEANLKLAPDDVRRGFLVSLHGPAGVGKTFLVRQFLRVARERDTLTGYIDESAYDLFNALELVVADIATQGGRFREFPALLNEYRQRRHELDADPTTPDEFPSTLTHTVARMGLHLAETIP